MGIKQEILTGDLIKYRKDPSFLFHPRILSGESWTEQIEDWVENNLKYDDILDEIKKGVYEGKTWKEIWGDTDLDEFADQYSLHGKDILNSEDITDISKDFEKIKEDVMEGEIKIKDFIDTVEKEFDVERKDVIKDHKELLENSKEYDTFEGYHRTYKDIMGLRKAYKDEKIASVDYYTALKDEYGIDIETSDEIYEKGFGRVFSKPKNPVK